LCALDAVLAGDRTLRSDYEWMKLELYDQMTRELSGGQMAAYLQQDVIPNEAFVLDRIGFEGRQLIERGRSHRTKAPNSDIGRQIPVRLGQLIRHARNAPQLLRERIIRAALGAEYDLLQLGRFRRSGELHLQMFDRLALAECLESAGFHNCRQVGPTESSIPHWPSFHLDADSEGNAFKPDSLYMEAVKL